MKVYLWTTDVLEIFAESQDPISANDIAEHFGISIQNAYVRIHRLRQWGMVKMEKRKKPRTYVITNWGQRFLKDRQNREEQEEP